MKTVQQRGYVLAGWCCFGLGFIGIFLPLLPTTIFWILAAWLWSKGNPGLAERVYQHPRFGKPTRQFLEHGIISRKGKVMAGIGISTSFVILLLLAELPVLAYIVTGIILASVIGWIMTRPEQ